MAQTDISILVKLRDQASAGLKSLGASFNQLDVATRSVANNVRTRVTSAFRSMSDSIQRAGFVAGSVLASLSILGKNILETGIQTEQTRIAFETLTGSIEKAGKLMKETSDFAKSTPFDLPTVQTGAKRLLAYGTAVEDIIPTFSMLGDVASGLGKDKLDPLITAFGQIQTKGRLMGQELLQLREAGFNLADALGITNQQLEEMVSREEISFEDVKQAFKNATSEGGRFFEGMKSQSKSLGGILSNIQDSLIRFKNSILGIDEEGNIAENSVFGKLRVSAEQFRQKLEEVGPKIGEFFGNLLANETAVRILTGAVIGLATAIGVTLIGAMLPALPVLLLLVGLGILITTQFDKIKESAEKLSEKLGGKEGLQQKWDSLKESLQEVWNFVESSLQPAIDELKVQLELLGEELKSLNIDWDLVFGILKIVGAFIIGSFVAILVVLTWIITGVIAVVRSIIAWFKDYWTQINSVENKILRFLNPLTRMYDTLKLIKNIGKITIDIVQNFVTKGKDKTNRAHGGLLESGQASIIGERGPELFVPSATGRVVPNKDLNKVARSNQSGINLTVNVGIYAGSESEKRNLARELMTALMLEAQGQGRSIEQMLALQV